MQKNQISHMRSFARARKAFSALGILVLLTGVFSPSALSAGVKVGDLVYAANVEDQWNLWVMEPKTGYTRQLTRTNKTERYPSVSPGGGEIAYVSGRKQIWIMDSLTGKTENVHLPIGVYANPTWSPTGDELAYVEYKALPADTGEIFRVKKENGFWQLPVKITTFPPMMTFPNYSSDGKLLACASFHRDPVLGVVEEIVVVDLATGIHTQLTHDKADSFYPVWSPDGTRLAYTSNLEGNFDVWIVSYPDGKRTRLTSNSAYDGEPTWSPDGARLAFVSSRTGHREVWIADCIGPDRRQLTHLNKTCSHPFWVK
ncbi:MAG: PD40 domain-containing protein [Desulfatibacillum sp.]|nr:PD40 domain-containing protein [Desulfatibacillum sp.]